MRVGKSANRLMGRGMFDVFMIREIKMNVVFSNTLLYESVMADVRERWQNNIQSFLMSERNLLVDYEDLESEFDYANEAGSSNDVGKKSRIQDDELWKKQRFGEIELPSRKKAKSLFDEEQARLERRKHRLMTLDVYSRHKELINQYFLCYPGATSKLQRDTSRDRTDYDVLRDNHRFLWNDDELTKAAEKSWEARLAKRYYDKLFKEYCIADLSQYKKNRIAMRWRTEKEVRLGKGQFECGNKRCSREDNLTSWEGSGDIDIASFPVNFAYVENSLKKNALVKLRLCPECSKMLNYHSQKKKLEKKDKQRHKKRLPHNGSQKKELFEQADSSQKQEPTSPNQASREVDHRTDEEMEKNDLMEIWRKSPGDIDPEKIAEQELDDFLDDLLL
uniref:Protein FRA10AC1 n=1 Tax=Setaria digitata TaxID=48799 RepID=A0A915PFX8_9BILA